MFDTPQHRDFLEECRLGMIEHRAREALPTLSNSPYLDKPHVTYAEYLARKSAQTPVHRNVQ